MLNRIAVIGGSQEGRNAIEAAAKGRGLLVVGAADPNDLPPGTVTAVTDGRPEDAVCGALALARRKEALITLFAEAIDCRESFRFGSSTRVMEHAARFARALSLSEEERLVLERGALVRDIGKIKIENRVLLKEGVLTYEEWRLLQQHTHIGADLVKEMEDFSDTEDIVRGHHECYDGDGYPEGLEGEATPYLARIMKICDVYCAMSSKRHYREGWATHEEAIEYLTSERGKHFDPKLIDTFIRENVGKPEEPDSSK